MCKRKSADTSDLPHVCRWCESAAVINDDSNVLCSRRGIVNMEFSCKYYCYDLLKRTPLQPPPMPSLSEDDLLL